MKSIDFGTCKAIIEICLDSDNESYRQIRREIFEPLYRQISMLGTPYRHNKIIDELDEMY